MSRKSRRGSSLVEFAVVGVPVLLIIISIMEISRALWTYSSLSYAVTEASRMAIVHGLNCTQPPNSCAIRVQDIAQRIADSSQGLFTDQMNVTLASTGGGATVNCSPLTSCLNNSVLWPTAPGNAPGSDVMITAVYPFQSPMTIFFPGLTSPTAPVATNLRAVAQEPIQF